MYKNKQIFDYYNPCQIGFYYTVISLTDSLLGCFGYKK